MGVRGGEMVRGGERDGGFEHAENLFLKLISQEPPDFPIKFHLSGERGGGGRRHREIEADYITSDTQLSAEKNKKR